MEPSHVLHFALIEYMWVFATEVRVLISDTSCSLLDVGALVKAQGTIYIDAQCCGLPYTVGWRRGVWGGGEEGFASLGKKLAHQVPVDLEQLRLVFRKRAILMLEHAAVVLEGLNLAVTDIQ